MWFEVNRFHLLTFISWQFSIILGGQNIFGIFTNHIPKWRCGDSEPTGDCSVYLACPRENLSFVDPQFTSIAMEFDWICGSSVYYRSLSLQIQYFGVLLGTLTLGALSDIFGRKPIGIAVLSFAIFNTFISGMTTNSTMYIAIRFLLGYSLGGFSVVLCPWIMEMLLPQQRIVLRGFFNWGWTRIILTLTCYFFREWRTAVFVSALSATPALILLIFVIPESPTWLHSKAKTIRMIQSEKKMARVAGVPYVPTVHKPIVHSKGIIETLRTKGLFKKISVLWFMWFVAGMSGYANDLNSNTITGDLYSNQLLFGIILVISKMILLFADTTFENFKRRTLHQGAQLCAVICFVSLTLFLVYNYHGTGFLIVNLLGTVFIEYTWDACYLCAIESMETSCRSSATGSCSLMARVGSLLAPVLTYANTLWPPAVFVTVSVLGSCSFLISYFFLHETKNVNLDNVHIDDDEKDPEEAPMVRKN